MAVLVALLRGINVGGHGKLSMTALRGLIEAEGGDDVSTYIQSGNAVFKSRKAASTLEKNLATAIEKEAGFKPSVFVIDREEYARILKNNPYAKNCEDPAKVLVMFLRAKAPAAAMKEITAALANGEAVSAKENALYFKAPQGVGQSKAAEKLGRLLPGGTMRNWRTCLKLADMAADLAG